MIRAFRDADAPDAAALLSHVIPEEITTVRGLLHRIHAEPARARRRDFVAVERGHVVGMAKALFRWSSSVEGVGRLWVGVRADRRHRGIGGELYRAAEDHLRERGAWKLESSSARESGDRFLERRGFAPTRTTTLSALDTASADLSGLDDLAAARAAAGFRVVPLGDVRDLAGVHRVYAEGERDMPGDEPEDNLGYAEWVRETIEHPDLDHGGSVVVVHGERPVSLAFLLVDRSTGRAENEMTATLVDYRHRGLARLAKLAAIRWARERGVHTLLTANDADNRDMLALNVHLGYRPILIQHELVRQLGPARPSASPGRPRGSAGRA